MSCTLTHHTVFVRMGTIFIYTILHIHAYELFTSMTLLRAELKSVWAVDVLWERPTHVGRENSYCAVQ